MKKIVFISSLATLLFYGLFLLFYDLIHQPFGLVPDEVTINPWLRGRVFGDGVEVPVMLFGSIAYVGVLYVLFRRSKHSAEFKMPKQVRHDRLILSLLVLFSVFVLLSLDHPILWDYNFFVGPAWKMVQGEAFGSFYMRYSLLMTSLFALMMHLKFRLPEMQLVIAASFIVWFFLYYFLASRMISNRWLLFLFVVALMVIRYLALFHDPTALPQNAPLRLDLWVLPFLVALRFGTLSIPTSIAFSATYLLDNNFGLFALLSYVAVLIWAFRGISGSFLRFLIPIGAAVVVQFLLFGSFTSPASQEFVSTQVDFIPISKTSLFWLIFATLPYYVFVVSVEREQRTKSLLLLLLAFAITHLTYFYGRSHDNSLLNISGLFILMFFVVLDRFRSSLGRRRYVIGIALIACSIVFFWKNIDGKFNLAINTLRSGQIVKPHPIDEHIEAIRPAIARYKQNNNKLFFLSIFDGYYHYRLDVPQPGFYTPLFGSIYLKDVINPLTSYLQNGYTVLFFEPQVEQLIPEFGLEVRPLRRSDLPQIGIGEVFLR